jgi:hypothetical protein
VALDALRGDGERRRLMPYASRRASATV